jgi:hypothetical protein
MVSPSLNSHRLVLCEGIEDAAFMRQLVRDRGLGSFNVRPVEDIGEVSGITGFSPALAVAPQISGFKKVQFVILLADSDQHPGQTFTQLCQQVTAANADPNVSGLFGVPTAINTYGGGFPRIKVVLMPTSSGSGALDSLLWEAMTQLYKKVTDCVEEATHCAGIATAPQQWPKAKIDKARVRMAISLTNKPDPAIALGKLWQRYPGLIPATHSTFDAVASQLVAV